MLYECIVITVPAPEIFLLLLIAHPFVNKPAKKSLGNLLKPELKRRDHPDAILGLFNVPSPFQKNRHLCHSIQAA